MAKKKKIGSYPNTMIVISLTAALFLIGFCAMLVIQSKKLVSIIRENIDVSVFVDKNTSEVGRDSILTEIRQKPYVQVTDDSTGIAFVSKEQAAQDFMEGTKENFTAFLGENPLRDSYRVKVREDYFEEAKLKAIQQDLEKINGVYEVVYQENLADAINKNITKLYIVLASFALVMLVIIVLLINNTIKLAIYSQRFLIRSMQLVGATNGFIQRPFLIRGATQGIVSALIASFFLIILEQVAVRNVEGMAQLQQYDKLTLVLAMLVVLGVLIGVVSTIQSLHRYLKMSLDELY